MNNATYIRHLNESIYTSIWNYFASTNQILAAIVLWTAAMTLAQNTPTVFMDEPTTYLDIRRQLEIMNTARELAARGKAVVLVLHDIALALERADRVAVLREGALVCWDIPETVFRSGVLQQTFRVGIERMEQRFSKTAVVAETIKHLEI